MVEAATPRDRGYTAWPDEPPSGRRSCRASYTPSPTTSPTLATPPHLAIPPHQSAVERRRSVRWIDALSDDGDKGASARGSASAAGAPAAKALSFTNRTVSSRGDFSRTTSDGLGDRLLSSPLGGAGASGGASGVGVPPAVTTVRSSTCVVL